MSLEEVQKLSRKERETMSRRAEILEAAERVFADSGFVSAKMEEIARQAEFSVGMLYKFFKSKEELYGALLDEKLDAMGNRLYAELERPVGSVEKIRNIFLVRVELMWEYRTFFRIFFQGAAVPVCDPRAGFSLEAWERYQRYVNEQQEIFSHGIESGEFQPVSASALTLVFEGLLRAYADIVTRDD
ncbi:MAG: TetR/AcrR family transcriptional regulator, partial [FCB group bacterium]|nr:TetR/AcrR family transcriptional regulator [FCB group bacterium]